MIKLTDEELHRQALVIDTHADTLQLVLDEKLDLAEGSDKLEIDLPKAAVGGLKALFFSIWVDPKLYSGQKAVDRAFGLIGALKTQAERHPDSIEIATTATGIERAVKSGKLAALMGVEGGHALNGNIENLYRLHNEGARYLTITWSNTNELGDSSGDLKSPSIKHHGGLTEMGRRVVSEMNRIGMIVDISHVSDQTFNDVLGITTKPVIASHSCARALCDHPRNLTDDMLTSVARNRGVVCINFYPLFLDNGFRKQKDEVDTSLKEEYRAIDEHSPDDPIRASSEKDRLQRKFLAKTESISYERIVDHIEYVIKIAGEDHVGLGSDFDGIPATPRGMRSVADLPKLTKELRHRGHRDETIRKILGGNVMRVCREVISE
ncbi:MAG TPA: dipeptidase [Blastocatellia bacterium]|nr:dipeptidase [Blastocatellia bacterium]